ncbi:MAG: class I SAM-dependent methyltransferase [Pseudomonadota bacterium]
MTIPANDSVENAVPPVSGRAGERPMSDDMAQLKSRLKATWMAGDYGRFAKYLEPGAREFFSRLDVRPGMRVLDVACGVGQLSFPAAHAGAEVTGIDIASNLIEQARARVRGEGVQVRFEEGDAESLPFADGEFDLVVSLIGAMFAPRPDRVAAELLRVCRPGGRIAMANWTPEGHVGEMFRLIGKYVPPPALMASPMLWGNEASVRERLGRGTSHIHLTRRLYAMHYPFPPAEVVEFFNTYYGPTVRAMASLSSDDQRTLSQELTSLWTRNNLTPAAGTTHVAAEYLEVIANRA